MIKFWACLKKNAVETILLLREAFGNEVLGVLMIQRWHKMFLNGRRLAEFKLWSGKSKTVCMVTNINTVVTTIEEDYLSTRYFILELKISWESIRQIIMDKLGVKRMCLAWVAHFLGM